MITPMRWAPVLLALLIGACSVPRLATQSAGSRTGQTPAELLAQVQGDADQMEQTRDPAARARLLDEALAAAQQCLTQAMADAACHYAHAQALGLAARERPVQAAASLKEMLASLAKAESLQPGLDHAGPARLSAIVLMRAPPWPLGPGDAESALMAAQRAVQRDGSYPPNLITLAQAQARTEGTAEARATYLKAQSAVQAWGQASAAERAQWQLTVEQGIKDLH